MTKLLINEHPLIVLPTLAVKVGLNESIILQQIHYWLDPRTNKNIKDGKHWVYNSYTSWQEQFPFLSAITIRRTITTLEKRNLLISKNYNSSSFNKVKWYTINYEELKAIEDSINTQSEDGSKGSGRSDQNDHIVGSNSTQDEIKQSSSNIKETETTTKTTTDNSIWSPNNCVPEREFIKIWNEVVECGRGEVSLTPKRSLLVSTRFRSYFNNDLDQWKKFCIKITRSKFLMGESKNFRASFDWALKEDSIVKISENAYETVDRVSGVDSNPNSDNEIQEKIKSHIRSIENHHWKEVNKMLLKQDLRTYIAWIQKLNFFEFRNDTVYLKAENPFVKDYVETNHSRDIKRCYRDIMKSDVNLKFIAEDSKTSKENWIDNI